MKRRIIYFALIIYSLVSCNYNHLQKENKNNVSIIMNDSINFKSGYSEVNGLKMYYEIYGQGKPLVLLHGGGSTIQSSFGRIIPQLAKNYTVVAVELQNHGRSGFRSEAETFEQDADDVTALLHNIKISKASFFGFSNGGTTAMQIGIRHPEIVEKLVLAASAYKRDGFMEGFFDGMKQATLENMPQELQGAFLKVNPDTAKLQIMFERDCDRMIAFADISDEKFKSIIFPTLIINGDADVVSTEHAVEMYRLLPNCQLAIIPGGHGECIGELTTLSNNNQDMSFVASMIHRFLEAPSGNT